MPRFVVERDFGHVGDDEIQEVAARSKVTGIEQFPDIGWEHSHVVSGESGTIKSFCVYSAPNAARLKEHADAVGAHQVVRVYEIIGDVTPAEIKV